MHLPRAGDVVHLGPAASVQFSVNAINFRVSRVQPADTADRDGWVWLDGYELDQNGDAVERRSVFVQLAGIQRAAVSAGR
jgi:hypothetical protein